MGLSPSWELNSSSATRGIPRNLWNRKVHNRVHNSPPLVPILSQIDPFDNLSSYFFKIHSSVSKRCTMRHSFMYYTKNKMAPKLYFQPMSRCFIGSPPTHRIWDTARQVDVLRVNEHTQPKHIIKLYFVHGNFSTLLRRLDQYKLGSGSSSKQGVMAVKWLDTASFVINWTGLYSASAWQQTCNVFAVSVNNSRHCPAFVWKYPEYHEFEMP